MRARQWAPLLLAGVCAACEAPRQGDALSTFAVGAAELHLPADRDALREQREDGLLFERDGLVLRVLSIPTEGADAPRTAASAAAAVGVRFELGEQAGELGHAPCRYAGTSSAECAIGTFVRGAEPWVRRGAFVEQGDRVLWIDVAGPAARVEDVDAWNEQLRDHASLRSPS